MKASELGNKGRFLKVSDIVRTQPELGDFFSIVEKVKEAPKGITAAYILVLDETPVTGCNEFPVNQTNNGRIIRFLEDNWRNDDLSNLVGCAIFFELKTYPDWLNEAGEPQVGIEIAMIEPADIDNFRSMKFKADPSRPVGMSASSPSGEMSAAARKRAEILARSGKVPPPMPPPPSDDDIPFGSEPVSDMSERKAGRVYQPKKGRR